MRRLACLLFLTSSLPLMAEAPNLSANSAEKPGAASSYVLAQRTYSAALISGDAVLLVAAIRLARSVTFLPPTAWEKTTSGEAPADQPTGMGLAPDPGSELAISIARAFAAEDPSLQDLVYDIDAQHPQGRQISGAMATSDLPGGMTDGWRLPLFGEVPAETALIGDGDSPLELTIVDEAGLPVCVQPSGFDPVICRFVPARNGFFDVRVHNPGSVQNSYRLLGN